MTLDRVAGPEILSIGNNIQLPETKKISLDNGIAVTRYDVPTAEVVQLSINFNAGLWHHPKKLVSSLTNRLMRDGTVNHTAREIANHFDFYGASLQNQHDSDFASYNLVCLKKHLPAVLPMLAEILQQPIFKEEELQLQCKIGKEGLKQEKEKTEVMASDAFYQTVFGKNHPYGRVNNAEDYDALSTADLKAYHQSHYHPGNAYIFVSGALDETIISLINQHLGTTNWKNQSAIISPNYKIEAAAEHKIYLEKKDAVQSALRLGNVTISNTHEDYNKLKIAVAVLGGYFGSRLMSNIREEKGYTYGIFSTITNKKNCNILRIATEVGKEVSQAALKEIYHEMAVMQQENIDEDELHQVRSYMLGSYVDGLSNIFHTTQLLNNLILFNRSPEDFYKGVATLKNITADEIKLMAQRYFNTTELFEVVAG